MMSPLSVAQFIEPGAVEFDVLLIDEASQMRPEDALGAISRSRQLIVVGDPKQLPPTTFFDRIEQNDDVSDEDAVETESILDLAMQQYGRPRRLIWHYRSRHDSLVAFSNRHFYDGELQVSPSPDRTGELGVRYQYVGGKYSGGVNPAEATRVAERAIEMMTTNSDYSLGVVAVNQPQRDLIRIEIERLLLEEPRAQKYVERWDEGLEPFIIKNLESIQGDERDVILISTVYGPDANGNVFQRFGPINSQTGWRRLNVLFTRAKYRLEVISSLRPGDIIVDEKTSRGARALRGYLEYVSSGRLDSGIVSGLSFESDFEQAVAQLLKERGYDCIPQVGVAGFRIDLAVQDPQNSSRFVLGIECDGRAYHSSKSARDRDRLKDEVLRRLGWRLHRIWSTDWFTDPNREVERVVAAIKEAVSPKSADNATWEGSAATAASPQASSGSVETASKTRFRSAETKTAGPKVNEVLLESDVLAALRAVLPPGASMERDRLLKSVATTLKQSLTRQLRSAVNKMISQEVRQGRLRVNPSWSVVRRP
jgi:very-short-patch-repair endonuclease